MYYVLFHYVGGRKERGFMRFTLESGVIKFLHDKYKKIEVEYIIETARSYHLGLIVTEELIKSVLEPEEKKPADYLGSLPTEEEQAAIDEEAIREKKQHPLLKDRKEEPSAMSKIADDIEEEQKEEKQGSKITLPDDLTDAEILKKNKAALARADKSLKAAKEQIGRETWRACTECKKNKIAPWNKKGICAECQAKRKTNRPYTKRNR